MAARPTRRAKPPRWCFECRVWLLAASTSRHLSRLPTVPCTSSGWRGWRLQYRARCQSQTRVAQETHKPSPLEGLPASRTPAHCHWCKCGSVEWGKLGHRVISRHWHKVRPILLKLLAAIYSALCTKLMRHSVSLVPQLAKTQSDQAPRMTSAVGADNARGTRMSGCSRRAIPCMPCNLHLVRDSGNAVPRLAISAKTKSCALPHRGQMRGTGTTSDRPMTAALRRGRNLLSPLRVSLRT